MNIPAPIKELHTYLWDKELVDYPQWQRFPVHLVRIIFAVVKDVATGLPTLRAMSLVYTTLLSLVPLLAVSFSVLKGFGVHNQIEPMLLNVLKPLGEKGVEITSQIIGFVDNIEVKYLGTLGLVLLIYTVVSLLRKIEGAFNYTWRITEVRRISQRFSDYLSVVLVGPVLVFTAIGITATISNSSVVTAITEIEPFGTLLLFVSKILPYILVIAAFTFVYILVPNTKVRFKSALLGGVIAGILWETAGFIFAYFVASSTNYTVIYSGFAILIMFMIWLYLSWLILLIGANVSYFYQNPERLTNQQRIVTLSCRLQEKLALMIMHKIGEGFHNNDELWTIETLSKALSVPTEALIMILNALEDNHLLIRSGDNAQSYLPSHSIENIKVQDILAAVRSTGESETLNPDILTSDKVIEDLITTTEHAINDTLGNYTLRDVVDIGSPKYDI